MSISAILIKMLDKVALALPVEFLDEMVFVGGCTTALLLNAPNSSENVRYTLDVDLIVDISTRTDWYSLERRLTEIGFVHDADSGIICRFKLDETIVDFMPTDESILGFTNRWYQSVLENTESYILPSGTTIKLLKPEYFLATKLEAFKGRGNEDILASKDIEDIFTLLNGRTNIIDEIFQAEKSLRSYLSEEFNKLTKHNDWQITIQGNFDTDASVEKINLIVNAIIKKWPKAY